MLDVVVYSMVYLGAALMVYNVYCFIRFARFIQSREKREGEGAELHERNGILYVPTVLLVLFLIGYVLVGLFGNPDLLVGGIFLGGSIFVFIMYKLMESITQRVIRSEQAEAKLQAAEASNQAKTAFLATISHEMRTPMNVILGLDSMALKDPSLSPETRSQLEKIGHNARHLLDLVNNVLDINRIETGELVAVCEQFRLCDVWEQLNAIAGTQCEAKGLTYETALSEEAEGWYEGDEVMIKQVLLAILDNAAKYTDAPGTVSLLIDAETGNDGVGVVTFSVSDTGVGISPENHEKIFEIFGQEDSSSTSRFGGSGLGLAAAKRKVDLMGGSIKVKSAKGEGSTFIVSIPLPSSAGPEQPVASSDEQGDGILVGKRVLIVEDVEDNAEIVADLLELEGVDSERAENGLVALEMFEQSPENHFDAILMDLRMPVMDGLEATRRIRALDRPDAKTVPIIALTANAFDTDVQQSLDAGMDMHMAKPTDAEHLYSVLRRFMRSTRA